MGYHRAEILGALVSIFLIWGLLVWLNIEAIHRIRQPPNDINADLMLITACIGFACNLLNFFALNAGCGGDHADAAEEDIDDSVSSNAGTFIRSNMNKSIGALSEHLMAIY
jgi:Co/Zn/Cd efflux system component